MSERGAGSGGRAGLLRGLTDALRWLLRPAGYLAFVVALWALSAAAALLGDEHELGFFARRLNGLIWRYPEVTRDGVRMAWVVWLALFALACSPYDPLATSWDEVALGALAAGVLWRRWIVSRQAAR